MTGGVIPYAVKIQREGDLGNHHENLQASGRTGCGSWRMDAARPDDIDREQGANKAPAKTE